MRYVGSRAVASGKHHDGNEQDQNDDDGAKYLDPARRARESIPGDARRLVDRQRGGR